MLGKITGMNEQEAKIYVVEGRNIDILKSTEIVAMDQDMAIEIYKQLYIDQVIELEDIIFEARIKEEKQMVKN
tara:strand:- start:3713 stop:3931 length:219 start_codon:yes stop_codon:yes gene_type:complete